MTTIVDYKTLIVVYTILIVDCKHDYGCLFLLSYTCGRYSTHSVSYYVVIAKAGTTDNSNCLKEEWSTSWLEQVILLSANKTNKKEPGSQAANKKNYYKDNNSQQSHYYQRT